MHGVPIYQYSNMQDHFPARKENALCFTHSFLSPPPEPSFSPHFFISALVAVYNDNIVGLLDGVCFTPWGCKMLPEAATSLDFLYTVF